MEGLDASVLQGLKVTVLKIVQVRYLDVFLFVYLLIYLLLLEWTLKYYGYPEH